MEAKKLATKGQLRPDALKLLNDAGGRRLESRYGDAARRLQLTRRQAVIAEIMDDE